MPGLEPVGHGVAEADLSACTAPRWSRTSKLAVFMVIGAVTALTVTVNVQRTSSAPTFVSSG